MYSGIETPCRSVQKFNEVSEGYAASIFKLEI